jgi:hypothetical protein
MTFAEWFKQLNAKRDKRPTFAELFKLASPAFACGILLVLTVQLAFGVFDLYTVPVAVATWLSLVGFLFVLTVVLGKLFGGMWDEYEKQQEAAAAEDREPPRQATRRLGPPPVRSVRLIVLIAYGNALVGGILAGLILDELLTGLVLALVLGSLGATTLLILWLLFHARFEQSGIRW